MQQHLLQLCLHRQKGEALFLYFSLEHGHGRSKYDGKTFSHFNHVFLISGGSSLSQGIFFSQILRKRYFATTVHRDINPKIS